MKSVKITVAVLVALFAIGLVGSSLEGTPTDAPSGVGTATREAVSGPTQGAVTPEASEASESDSVFVEAPEAVEPTYGTPRPKHFDITFKVLSQDCYGSGMGCSLTVRPQLEKVGGRDLDPTNTYELTYEVGGADDSAIRTMELVGESYSADSELWLETPSRDATLSAKIISVTEREGWTGDYPFCGEGVLGACIDPSTGELRS